MVKLPDRALPELACGVPDAKPAQSGTPRAEASPQSYQIAGARRPPLAVAFSQYVRVPQRYAFRYKPTETVVLGRTWCAPRAWTGGSTTCLSATGACGLGRQCR